MARSTRALGWWDRRHKSVYSRPIDIPVCPPVNAASLLRTRGNLREKKGVTALLFREAVHSDVHVDDLNGLLK